MKLFHLWIISVVSLFFLACDGGVNSVTVKQTGETLFNPPLQEVTDPQETQPVVVIPEPELEAPTEPLPVINTPPVIPTIPVVPPPDITVPIVEDNASSILDGLPALSRSVVLTERESLGMPRVNGEKLQGDLYGEEILIIEYTQTLQKVRYSNDIKSFTTLGQVEGAKAKTTFPVAFIKIFFEDANGDSANKIFGVVE